MAQLLEAKPLVEDCCMFERPTCCHRFERLQEAAALGELKELGDGPRPRFTRDTAGNAMILPEAKSGAEDRPGVVGPRIIHHPRLAIHAAQRDNRIGGAEVNADRASQRSHDSVLLCADCGGGLAAIAGMDGRRNQSHAPSGMVLGERAFGKDGWIRRGGSVSFVSVPNEMVVRLQ